MPNSKRCVKVMDLNPETQRECSIIELVKKKNESLTHRFRFFDLTNVHLTETDGKKVAIIEMPLSQTGDLFDHIQRHFHDADWSSRVMLLSSQVLTSIVRLHRIGVAHRDIKCENFLMSDARGGRNIGTVIDFGFSVLLNELQETVKRKECGADGSASAVRNSGTILYCSPELLRNCEEPLSDSKATHIAIDIWALGVVFYALVTNALPFGVACGQRSEAFKVYSELGTPNHRIQWILHRFTEYAVHPTLSWYMAGIIAPMLDPCPHTRKIPPKVFEKLYEGHVAMQST